MVDNGWVESGWVFNIQKFSLHDGPGIRDLIFLKGCPLRCQWCSNPESQRPHPEIVYKIDRCIGFEVCGLCKNQCPEKAISKRDGGKANIDRSRCNHCGNCATVCPDGALALVGREMSIAEILDVVAADDGFHFRSGGGVTVGGGDPILQSDFVGALLKACRARGIDTAVETAGYGRWDQLEKICRYANLIFYDVKSMDVKKTPGLHRCIQCAHPGKFDQVVDPFSRNSHHRTYADYSRLQSYQQRYYSHREIFKNH